MSHDSASERPAMFNDDDVRRLGAAWAVNVMADAVRAHADGLLAAPPRVSADVALTSTSVSSDDAGDGFGGDGAAPEHGVGVVSPGRIVMTAGRTREWFGYRVYDTVDTTRGQQVVVVHDGMTGDVTAIAVGSELGAYRTGALGGVAMRELVGPRQDASAPDGDAARGGDGAARPARLAIIGAGGQAWTQLWAAMGVLDIEEVRVAARTRASAEGFCERARREFGISCEPIDSARDAVRGADVVILATSSSTPVIEAAWLEPDCVVVTLGPKQVGRSEFGPDLLVGAFVTTDSIDQLHAYDPPALASQRMTGSDHMTAGVVDAVISLGDVLTGRVLPPPAGRRVHLSVGLAGTEVALLAAMARTPGTPSGAQSLQPGTQDVARSTPAEARRGGPPPGPASPLHSSSGEPR